MKSRSTAIFFILFLLLSSSCSTGSNINLGPEVDARRVRELIDEFGIETYSSSSWPELYLNGKEINRGMLDLIDKAEKYIVIDTFLIVNDEYGKVILETLAEKSAEGVAVYVMADSSSVFLGKESGFSYLEEQGIPWTEYNPIRPWNLLPVIKAYELFYRDHRKYWVVDGRYVLLGGSNIIDTSLKPVDQGGNTDAMVLIESKEVAEQLLESFIQNWNKYSEYPFDVDNFESIRNTPAETAVALFNQEAKDKQPVIELMVNRLFALAEHEVWLIQPYTFVNDQMLAYIEELKTRGIKVHIVLSGTANHEKFYYASYYGIKDLIEAGAEVWIYSYKESPLHLKAFVIDDKYFSIGSANFNKRSFKLSAEANLIFSDPKSFEVLSRSLDKIKKNIRKVSPAEAEEYRGIEYKRWHLIMQNTG